MAIPPIADVDVTLYKQHAAPAWQNLNANYWNTVEAAGFLPQLIEFFGGRPQALKAVGGRTIQAIFNAQANYWRSHLDDPKTPFAFSFRQQWGAWPNAIEVDSTVPWFTKGQTPAPMPEPISFLDDIIAFAQGNPLVAGGIALGAFLILTKKLRL